MMSMFGTVATLVGVVIIAVNAVTSGDPGGARFFGALFIISGLLLRIEASVSRKSAAREEATSTWDGHES